ncbi:MAG: TldD/PmbA family protein [Thermodesulfobacteriota bacterium]|nr:TldD/PmbA family protein [Thermodesulfobacteriota bacterium]
MKGMWSEKKIKHLFDRALGLSSADQTEMVLFSRDLSLTRFANNYIHQNIHENNAVLSVRVVCGKRVGIAHTNSLDDEKVEKTIERASVLAKASAENPDFLSLPRPQPIKEIKCFAESTARQTPEKRAKDVTLICKKAKENGLTASGAFSTTVSQIAVANSLGLFACNVGSMAEMSTVVMSHTSSGYAEGLSTDVSEIDIEALSDEAINKALTSKDPVSLPKGAYTVVLEEYAASDILSFLGMLGFGAQSVQEGRSFMCGSFGEKIFNKHITIWDDGLSRYTIPMPFDFEGVPKRRVDFIKDGVARTVCYDSFTAGKEGKHSTGHSLPPGEVMGPLPMNLFFSSGTTSLEEMITSIDRGILVSRFHYTRPVHPTTVTITGMTRDGTFLIERGEIAFPVKNLRFTQSYLEALQQVAMIGKDTRLVRCSASFCRVPPLKIDSFNFVGSTEF